MITHQALTKALMKRARKAYESDDDHEMRAKELSNSIVEPLVHYLDYDELQVSMKNNFKELEKFS